MSPQTDQSIRRATPLVDHLARLTRAKAEAALAPLGLRPRHLVALTVLRDQGTASQQELAGILRLDKTNLVGLLNELEDDGLVIRERSAEDRRRHNVTLTAAGTERLEAAEVELRSVEDDVLAALDQEQRDTLYELLQIATQGFASSCTEVIADEPAC